MNRTNYLNKKLANEYVSNNQDMFNSLFENDEKELERFFQEEFPQSFENLIYDMIMNTMMNESWIGDKFQNIKQGVKNVTSKVWQSIKEAFTIIIKILNTVFKSFISKLKEKIKELSAEIKEFLSFLYASLISNELVSTDGKIKWSETVDSLFGTIKETKTGKDPKNTDSINQLHSFFKTNMNGSISESLQEELTSSVLEAWNKPSTWFGNKKTDQTKTNQTQNNQPQNNQPQNNQPQNNQPQNNQPQNTNTNQNQTQPDSDVVTFDVKSNNQEINLGSKKITKEQLADYSVGIFTKWLTKLGLDSPRLQVIVTKVVWIVVGLIISLLIPAIAASAGGALFGAAAAATIGTILQIIGIILVVLGVVMLASWLIKGYPSVQEYIEYLEAWFYCYPSGIRKEEDKGDNNEPSQPKKISNFDEYQKRKKEGVLQELTPEQKLEKLKRRIESKKDSKCDLFGKWKAISKKLANDESNKITREMLNVVVNRLKELGYDESQFEEQYNSCKGEIKRKKEEKRLNITQQNQEKKPQMVSVKDKETGKWRVGVKK